MKKILHIVRKELWQVSRDPNMLRIIFIVPLFQLVVLGYAITTDIKNLDLLICDNDRTQLSRSLAERFSHTESFRVRHGEINMPRGRVEDAIFNNRAVLALVIPRGFARDLERGHPTEVQILVDGQNSNSSAVAMGYCNRILLAFMQDRLQEGRARAGAVAPHVNTIRPVNRAWYNPELKSVYFMIPGIISLLLTIITMLLTGLAIVKEREIGTLDQLLVTPIKPWQLIAGKTIPYALLGLLEMAIAMTFGVIWFHVPLAGRLPLLVLLSTCFILTSLGLGIFISTLVSTQQQALFTSWFFLVTFILLSGFFYPLENMPEWVRAITVINPLRYFIAILRELFLKGAGLDVLWPELSALLAIGIAIFTLAVLRFKGRE